MINRKVVSGGREEKCICAGEMESVHADEVPFLNLEVQQMDVDVQLILTL